MSKANEDQSHYCKSGFKLTFIVELLGVDVWHDCNEGTLELGPCVQGLKLHYTLYPGHTYDIDVLIWPHAAKIWCGLDYGWVRTWMFLNRKWLGFSIQHCFPVRVKEFQNHIVSIMPTMGIGNLSANAKNDKNYQVLLPPLKFGELRYFGSVCDIDNNLDHVDKFTQEPFDKFIQDIIWKSVEEYIPASLLDEIFNVPETVKDARHQDAALLNLTQTLFKNSIEEEEERDFEEIKTDKYGKKEADKDKKKGQESKVKYELTITGDEILAGSGKVIPFEVVGDRALDLGEVIALISTSNLPAQDDDPIFFVNVEKLFQVPHRALKKLGVGQIYTRWKLGNEKHDSKPWPIKKTSEIQIDDHHVVIIESSNASFMTNCFLEDYYEIQLRGLKNKAVFPSSPVYFGHDQNDEEYDKKFPDVSIGDDSDFVIAVTKIDTRKIVDGLSILIWGEFSLYPLNKLLCDHERPKCCTNDINGIGLSVRPKTIVPSNLILESEMSLKVSLGFVGCKPCKLGQSFSRMYAIVDNYDITARILNSALELNKSLIMDHRVEDILTGFVIDTGNVVFLFIEGPTDGTVLNIWELSDDYFPVIKPLFSNSEKYISRLYPDLLFAATPIQVYKMFVPLSALLACPLVYVRPALPLPTRSVVMKISRIIAKGLRVSPSRSEMPTSSELRSFKLELCVPPRPTVSVN